MSGSAAGRWPAERLDPESYLAPGVDLPVLYNDLDPNHHLNNVAFGRFFEHARVVANVGLRKALAGAGNVLVARVAIDYLVEGRFGPPLHVRTRVARIGRSSVTLEQAAWQDGACIALAEVVLVHAIGGRSAPLPDAVQSVFTPMFIRTRRV